MAKEVDLQTDLKNFVHFVCEAKAVNAEHLVTSTINLLIRCPTARNAVLDFYSKLFDEYCDQYFAGVASGSGDTMGMIRRTSGFLSRLKTSHVSSLPTPEGIETRRISTDSRKVSTESTTNDTTTPQSPPPIGQVEVMEEAVEEDDKNNLDMLLDRVGEALLSLLEKQADEPSFSRIANWALELMSTLSSKYSPTKSIPHSSTPFAERLSDTIRHWLECRVISLLLNLVLSSLSANTDHPAVVATLIKFSPHSDWISAHLITCIPSSKDMKPLSDCIEILLKSSASPSSVTSILSYLSEHNPRAIINSSKTNIPFLLKLCANSKPLLNVLAIEATKQINIELLNDLSLSLTDDLKDHVLYCLLNAPNAFDLMVLLFDVYTHREANDRVKSQALLVFSAVVNQVHEFVYGGSINAGAAPPILVILKANVEQLILHSVSKGPTSLRRLQLRLIQLLCVYFGFGFTSQVLHTMLNSLRVEFKLFNTTSMPPSIVVSLLKSLRLPFGSEIQKFFLHVVRLPAKKSPNFWANLITIMECDDSVDMDIDILTDQFTEMLQENNCLDQSRFYLLRLIHCCMEKFPKVVGKPKHHLCIALVVDYLALVRAIERDAVHEHIELFMHSLSLTQKCMSNLSRKQTTNQHILCRALLESILHWNKPTVVKPQVNGRNGVEVVLREENVRYGTGNSFKFRKIPLNSFKSGLLANRAAEVVDSSLTQQLLLDGVRSCVIEMPSFAILLVECVTPDVMFNDLPWPDEDFLKVTIERDLHIARMFEFNPILWDFCELIGNAGCLHYGAVLIRALMAVQLTQWASATASKEKLGSTQKLVTLISKGGLIPDMPFKFLPKVLPSLGPWEIFCVLNDLWRHMKDNSSSMPPSSRPLAMPLRKYLERLRIIMAENFPGSFYVKIFKGLV